MLTNMVAVILANNQMIYILVSYSYPESAYIVKHCIAAYIANSCIYNVCVCVCWIVLECITTWGMHALLKMGSYSCGNQNDSFEE